MNFRILSLALIALGSPSLPLLGEPPIIDDLELAKKMTDSLGKLAGEKKALSGKDLAAQLSKAPNRIELAPEGLATIARSRYEDQIRSVYLIGSIYNCGKCAHWHSSGNATAWCLSRDGVLVTNDHVFRSGRGEAVGVCDFKGNVMPVTEILAADEGADIAIFRVDRGNTVLEPLLLGDEAAVGSKVHLISHPDGRYFFRSSGEVARYYRSPGKSDRKPMVWLSVTADFAKGSSGGPVFDAEGRVVGMVAFTQSIYYGNRGEEEDRQGPLQMVVKSTVPAFSIRGLIASPQPVKR